MSATRFVFNCQQEFPPQRKTIITHCNCLFYRFEKSLPALGGNHQNNITTSSGLIASFALE